MPTPKSKKPNSPKKSLWRKRSTKVLLVIVGLVVGGLAYGVYAHVQEQRTITADRERFEAADRDIQSVATMIKSQIPPEKESYKKECTTQSRDYEEEPIICGISYFFLGGVNSIDEANLMGSKIRKTLTDNHIVDLKSVSNGTAVNTSTPKQLFSNSLADVIQTSSDLFESPSSRMSCSMIYQTYPSTITFPPEEGLVSESPRSVLITAYCHGQAKIKHY
jgi:hypothetical protein